ncbi:MAG: DNA translocase FtsK 4TM domain-containing protein, partial [Deltaproteobacteria bacterium]|nr:DNA translocase FtsK 4TM domain-containing protein [Deltaproteobacteria bacterium]
MFPKLDRRAKEITALCLFGLVLLLLLSLVTYNSGDPTLFTASSGQRPVQNAVGIVGANLAAILLVAVDPSSRCRSKRLLATRLSLVWSPGTFPAAGNLAPTITRHRLYPARHCLERFGCALLARTSALGRAFARKWRHIGFGSEEVSAILSQADGCLPPA